MIEFGVIGDRSVLIGLGERDLLLSYRFGVGDLLDP